MEQKHIISKQIEIKTPAPDFSLQDFRGEEFVFSEMIGKKNVLLIFNRGFT
jgi:peroxiredoxin